MKLSNPEIHELHGQIAGLKATMASESMKLNSMKVYDVSNLQADLDILEGTLKLHNDAVAADAAAERKRVQASMKKLLKLKDELYKLKESINEDVSALHHTHKGAFFDLERALGAMLRGHKLTTTTKTKRTA